MLSNVAIALIAGSCLAMPTMAAAETAAAPDQAAGAQPPAAPYVPASGPADTRPSLSDDRLAIFTPTSDPIRHTIDYEIWDFALKNILISMGPSDRQGAPRPEPLTSTRIKHGPQSRYRLEGSMVLFRFFDDDVIASFADYRRDLEGVAETLDISTLPRNEQLAFWINLHNVALMEQIARDWPVRQPRDIELDGVPLDEAKFITLRGIPVSLRDIREKIVFRHWKDPKVIYGFWRGDIGGPQLQSYAFTGANVGSLLDIAGADFVNSLRGTQKRGDRLDVAQLYAEVAPFYFPDFQTDLRAHLTDFADEPVLTLLARTSEIRPTISEPDIADLHGGARPPAYMAVQIPGCPSAWGDAACSVIAARKRKLEAMERKGQPTGRVFFSNIDLPGDPPNKNAVE
ncbi:DUF547 domain-containing protein [Erythrobacter donghaensis]|uniref:DUF547 domain-containing protein n=1 Tax=Erythrobacter donghaensis TaxID=267135 RepID=UPI001FECB5EA|nr:DUF547 domain-containing protein [Erythrobacter donghaensis]